MRYFLRNDDVYTVTVEYVPAYRTYLVEVHQGLEQIVHHEFETAQECLDMAARFVDHHVSSLYLWSLNADSTAPPRVREKSAAYTADCRRKVANYLGRAA